MNEIVLEIAMALQLAVAIAAAAVLFVWWRSRGRIWSLEQRVSKLEGVLGGELERERRVEFLEQRVSKLEGVLEFFAKGD